MERFNYRYSHPGVVASGNVISPQTSKSVANAYMKVMNEVCATVRETFLDEGVEISVLQELRSLWEHKLHESKVLESNRPSIEPASSVSRNSAAAALYGNLYGSQTAPSGHPALHIPTAAARVEQQSFGDSLSAAGGSSSSQQMFQQQILNAQAISGAAASRLPANARMIGVNMPAGLPPGSTVRVLRAPIQSALPAGVAGAVGNPNVISNIVPLTSAQPSQASITPSYASDNSNTIPARGSNGPDFVQIDGARPVIHDDLDQIQMVLTPQQTEGPHTTQQHKTTKTSARRQPKLAAATKSLAKSSSLGANTNAVAPALGATVGTALPGVSKMFLQLDGQGALNDSDDDDDSDDDEFEDADPNPHTTAKSQKLASSSNKSSARIVPKTEPGDGTDADDSSDDDSDDDNKNLGTNKSGEGAQNEDGDGAEDEEPLNSEDDVTDDEASNFAAGEDTVVCQYERVRRTKNHWTLTLRDGIMYVQGRDILFHRAEVMCDW